MTDKLRQAAEMMFESLANAHESLIDVENALRQALAEPPSTQSQELVGKTERLEAENKRLQELEEKNNA